MALNSIQSRAPYLKTTPKEKRKLSGKHDHTGSGNYMLGYVVGADTVLYEAYMKALKPKT